MNAVRRLSLDEYRELLRGTAVPTHEQIDEFARFVCTAHSWYKHLPLWPPGAPMRFFLDPSAGMQREVDRRGRADWSDESGGTGTLTQLMRRVEALIEGADPEEVPRFGVDRVLHDLLSAERMRQQHGIVRALERVVAL